MAPRKRNGARDEMPRRGPDGPTSGESRFLFFPALLCFQCSPLVPPCEPLNATLCFKQSHNPSIIWPSVCRRPRSDFVRLFDLHIRTRVSTETLTSELRTSVCVTAHQRAEGDDLEDALQGEEGREEDVQVFQHGLVQVWGSVELRTGGEETYTECIECMIDSWCRPIARLCLCKQ